MILKYGSGSTHYTHADNECAIVRTMSRQFNAASQLLSVTRRWDITGKLIGDDSAAIITAKKALERAYATQFQDMYLYLSDGTTVHDGLVNTGSISGVQILSGPTYPNGTGAEGGTFLTYALSAQVVYDFDWSGVGGVGTGGGGGQNQPGDPGRLETFTETITITGGGPRYVWVEVVQGDPVRQLVNTNTKCRVVQSGQATGRRQYPNPPTPVFADSENPAERVISQSSPEGAGQQSTGWKTSWTYVMEGPGIGGIPPGAWPKT